MHLFIPTRQTMGSSVYMVIRKLLKIYARLLILIENEFCSSQSVLTEMATGGFFIPVIMVHENTAVVMLVC